MTTLDPGGADTREIPLRLVPSPRRPRRWSKARRTSMLIALVTGFLFVLDLTSQPRHGTAVLPQVSLDIIRSAWIIALSATLAIWAYEAIAPGVVAWFGFLRQALRDGRDAQNQSLGMHVHHQVRLGELRSEISTNRAEIAELRRQVAAVAAHRQAQHDQLVHEMERLVAVMTKLADDVGSHCMEEYARGFHRALDRVAGDDLGQSPQAPERGRQVVPFTPRNRRDR